MHVRDLPTGLVEFLLWFRNRTEEVWSNYKTRTLEDFQRAGVGGKDWLRGTKWSAGLSDEEIEGVEQRWSLKFPPDYREFLKILGTPDRAMFSVGWKGKEMVTNENGYSFYDWRDDKQIQSAYDYLLEGVVFDVEHNSLWLSEWGVKPNTESDRRKIVMLALAAAPTLIPVFGHRFLLGTPPQSGNPILSVVQTDIIIYGRDLRSYLIGEFSQLLGIELETSVEVGSEKQDESWYQDFVRSTPFWGELIAINDRDSLKSSI